MEKQEARKNAAQELKMITSAILEVLKENPKLSQIAIKKELKKILGLEISQPTIHRYLTVELGMEKDKQKGWVAVERDAKQIYRERMKGLLKEGRVKESVFPVQLAVLKLEEGYAGLFEVQIKGGYEEALAGSVVLSGGLLLAVKCNELGAELLSNLGFEQEK